MGKKLTTEEFIERAKSIHGDKYDYSRVEYKGMHQKCEFVCSEHGSFWQTPNSHLNLKHGCPRCSGRYKLTTEEFIKKARKVHGNRYDYSRVEYKGALNKVEIICKDHGSFWQRSCDHLCGSGCPICANENNKLSIVEFIKRAKEVHGDKYDYSKVKYKTLKNKSEFICKMHGSFWQTPGNHLKGAGCPKCAKRYVPSTEEFIEKAKEVHGDTYDYSETEYIKCMEKSKFICKKHGYFLQTPNDHLNGHGCPKCARDNIKLTTEEFIKRARKVHGDRYDYSRVEYKGIKENLEVICIDHGPFWQRADLHLRGNGCPECNRRKLTTEEFIERAKSVHGDKYDYSKVKYKNNSEKVEMICSDHGSFWQAPGNHLLGQGCPKCGGTHKLTTKEFIKRAKKIHGDRYDYSCAVYKSMHEKVEMICSDHGSFWQVPYSHLKGTGCPKCTGRYKEKYAKNNIPVYDTYEPQLSPYGIECRRNKSDENILEVKCMYCGKWYIPSLQSVMGKIKSIKGKTGGEQNLYCSDNCKQACPTFRQRKYPKGFKTNTSREVQPSLRKLVLKRDNYTCQKCGATDAELHCHHYEGIKVNPIESADMDNCITLCKKCHNEIHTKEKCGMKDYKC